MSTFEVTVQVRNNRLKERRIALGMTQARLAAAANVSLAGYRDLEALRLSPRSRVDRRWREIALRLARFHCVDPEELFPTAVFAVRKPVRRGTADLAESFSLLTTHQERLLEGPDAHDERVELRERLRYALTGLPPREAQVLRLRFGLADGEEHTRDEVAAVLGVAGTAVRQIETRALRLLRHPTRARGLRGFHSPGALDHASL